MNRHSVIILLLSQAMFAAALACFLLPTPSVRAATPIYVRTDGADTCTGAVDAPFSGGSACAKLTLQAGVTAVDSGGSVIIRGGTFGSTTVTIDKDVTIQGAGADVTFLEGTLSGSDSVITITTGFTADISRVTIQYGWGDSGGGILISGGRLLLSNSIVTLNTANVSGGGISVQGAGSAVLTNTTISRNNSHLGGGIYNVGSITVTNSTIFNNHAALQSSSEGGGMRTNGPTMLTNVTISGNDTNTDGGGLIVSTGAIATLNNVTISSNEADKDGNSSGGGGGVWFGSATVELRNSLIAGNFDATGGSVDCFSSDQFSSLGYNLVGINTSCVITPTTGDQFGTGLTPIDPHLAALGDNGGTTMTHALQLNSPARNAGNPAAPGSGGNACAAIDQRGYPRPAGGTGGRCDIGAYEYTVQIDLPLIKR